MGRHQHRGLSHRCPARVHHGFYRHRRLTVDHCRDEDPHQGRRHPSPGRPGRDSRMRPNVMPVAPANRGEVHVVAIAVIDDAPHRGHFQAGSPGSRIQQRFDHRHPDRLVARRSPDRRHARERPGPAPQPEMPPTAIVHARIVRPAGRSRPHRIVLHAFQPLSPTSLPEVSNFRVLTDFRPPPPASF